MHVRSVLIVGVQIGASVDLLHRVVAKELASSSSKHENTKCTRSKLLLDEAEKYQGLGRRPVSSKLEQLVSKPSRLNSSLPLDRS